MCLSRNIFESQIYLNSQLVCGSGNGLFLGGYHSSCQRSDVYRLAKFTNVLFRFRNHRSTH